MTCLRNHTLGGLYALGISLLLCHVAFAVQETVGITEITPNLLVFSTTAGNVVASVGKDGALLIGTPSASSTQQLSDALAARTKSSFRYVVIAPADPKHSEGDAGWQRRGAFVAMHENTLQHLGGNVMGVPPPPPAQFAALGVERPRIAFSEVLAFDLNGESIHVVHQKPGYSNADALVHFHVAMLIYLGEDFPGDGYPLNRQFARRHTRWPSEQAQPLGGPSLQDCTGAGKSQRWRDPEGVPRHDCDGSQPCSTFG